MKQQNSPFTAVIFVGILLTLLGFHLLPFQANAKEAPDFKALEDWECSTTHELTSWIYKSTQKTEYRIGEKRIRLKVIEVPKGFYTYDQSASAVAYASGPNKSGRYLRIAKLKTTASGRLIWSSDKLDDLEILQHIPRTMPPGGRGWPGILHAVSKREDVLYPEQRQESLILACQLDDCRFSLVSHSTSAVGLTHSQYGYCSLLKKVTETFK